ncbi:MAG: cell division protein ZapE [Gammaproteobacteria bacterium]|nr:cell division protein ZapE [Gammaproteobacteria bacterium]
MSPMQRYQSDLARGDLTPDAAQLRAVQRLQDLYERLLQPQEAMGLLGRLMGKRSAKAPECGLYLWGDTGRGKTYLMDTFFDALPFTQKRRVHFQHFMKDIHQALKDLPKTPDPMPLVAAQVAAQIRVLCLDEFQVLDITDAMILAGFLQGLFAQGVTLVTTSNIAPDDLYLNGLQRSRFVPAIGLLKQHTETVFLDSATDYRLQLLEKDGTYHVLGFDQGDELLSAEFAKVTQQTPASGVMTVNGRQIPVRGCHGDVVWFDFAALCDTPRSSLDYIAIAQEYQTLLLGRVPSMRGGRDDAAQRFIQLVDALYDHGVKLVVVAEKAPDELYGEGRLAFPFQRTQSRLFEMRSHEYLGRKHGKQND